MKTWRAIFARPPILAIMNLRHMVGAKLASACNIILGTPNRQATGRAIHMRWPEPGNSAPHFASTPRDSGLSAIAL